MRLKSKIIVICSIVVLLAASLCSISVYVIMDKNFHEEAAASPIRCPPCTVINPCRISSS